LPPPAAAASAGVTFGHRYRAGDQGGSKLDQNAGFCGIFLAAQVES